MRLIYIAGLLLTLTGCATWTTGSTTPMTGTSSQPRDPATIIVTENDLTARPYAVVGDISVSVHKTTLIRRGSDEGEAQRGYAARSREDRGRCCEPCQVWHRRQ